MNLPITSGCLRSSRRGLLHAWLHACLLPLLLGLSMASQAASDTDLASTPLNALLDMEVSGASKFTLHMSDAPASVSVMTAAQIRALGLRTLAEVLQTVRGLATTSDRTYTYLSVRGLWVPGDYNTRVLVLIDGNRINDTVYEQALAGSEFPLDIDLVERVEFIPGQGSAVHGANALYGVVNVVTRHPAQGAPREIAVALAPGNTRQARASGSIEAGDGTLLLSVTGLRMAGTDAVYDDGRVSRDTDHERSTKLFAKYSGPEFNATLIHGDRTKGLTNIQSTVFGDPRSNSRDAETLVDLAWSRQIDDTSRWKLRGYAGAYDFRGDYLMDDGLGTVNRDGIVSRWWGMEANVFTERFAGHKLVLGADWQASTHRDQTNVDLDPGAVYLDDHRSGHRLALFVEDQWLLHPELSITLGVRHDRMESGDSKLSPRVATVWRASERWIFKFGHGRAFRPANAFESFYNTPVAGGYKGNTRLHPEDVTGEELVAEFRPDSATRATATAYANHTRGLLVQAVDPADGMLVFSNTGTFDAHGLELEAEHVWPHGAQAKASYSIHQVNGASAPGIAAGNAAHLAKLLATWPFGRDWTAGLHTELVGRRGDTAGYGITGLTLTRSFGTPRSSLSLSIDDLLDRRPSDPGADSVLQDRTPLYGRGVRLKLELAF
ncbi:TonB-dependent receptor plug domain-containing protein [Piscinibacter terrae]|uniref:TonB-dependent receptor n=1 Tax=Piscinibacter terrae TaxID=2496871 RepID=A0A3N7IWC8_9BURK|nr:TonB-dependent receptor [Albitalea terrae]RQP23082.1 TonB-dependent receptor [Albitalea terrae]